MTASSEKIRIVIALTESCPVPKLWQAAMEHLSQTPAELVTVFLEDERWPRAASLSFTREVPRTGGSSLDFTQERAQEIHRETAKQAKKLIEQLAEESETDVAFETLSESDRRRLAELIEGQQSILIAANVIVARPIYVHFENLGCHIELIEDSGDDEPSD